jgi:hypothetical protein
MFLGGTAACFRTEGLQSLQPTACAGAIMSTPLHPIAQVPLSAMLTWTTLPAHAR